VAGRAQFGGGHPHRFAQAVGERGARSVVRVAIVGAGRQGLRRLQAIQEVGGDDVVVVADKSREAAESLAARANCPWSTDWRSALDASADAVLICTPPYTHDEIARQALRAGRHVLCEKPLATTVPAAWEMVAEAERAGRVLKCGFNYRFHPAIQRARTLLQDGQLGRLIELRSRHGTGGRPQFEREWRTHAGESGGGILMDQGVHVLDLFHWLAGPFQRVIARTATSYWPIAPVEDNVVAVFVGENVLAGLHVSWTQWKNLFTFDLFLSEGSIRIEGLGGSYGDERLIVRRGAGEDRVMEVIEFRGPDPSWQAEWREFAAAASEGRQPSGSGRDGAEVLTLVEAIYNSARGARAVEIATVSAVGAAP
jgi:predicted dehydrogenase